MALDKVTKIEEGRPSKELEALATYFGATLPKNGFVAARKLNWGVCLVALAATYAFAVSGHPVWATVAAFLSAPPFVFVWHTSSPMWILKPPAQDKSGLIQTVAEIPSKSSRH